MVAVRDFRRGGPGHRGRRRIQMVLVSVVRELMGVLFGELCWQNKGFIRGFFNPKALWTRAEPSGTKDQPHYKSYGDIEPSARILAFNSSFISTKRRKTRRVETVETGCAQYVVGGHSAKDSVLGSCSPFTCRSHMKNILHEGHLAMHRKTRSKRFGRAIAQMNSGLQKGCGQNKLHVFST